MIVALLAGTLALAAPFVSVDDAVRLVDGGATVLDARERGYRDGHLPGARPIDWKEYRDGWGRTGRLDDDAGSLARRLAALGVDDGHAVLVYGAAHRGWGEEGRVAWMLAYLGHPRVHLLDGGFEAWREAGRPIESGRAPAVRRGTFTPRPRIDLRADLAAVRDGRALVIDVRTDAEWRGATPYWEHRGGHVPGARHLEWTALLDERGRLRALDELRARLAAVGAQPSRPVIVYCTGGVRSAFAWAVLRAAGFTDVRNWDGSWFEWARRKDLPVTVGGPD